MDAVCPALQVFHVTPGVNIVKMLSACDQNICGEDESEGENQLLAKKKGKIKKKIQSLHLFSNIMHLYLK